MCLGVLSLPLREHWFRDSVFRADSWRNRARARVGARKGLGYNREVVSAKRRLLFICTANQNRSPTAEALLARSQRYEARSAGVSPLATRPVTRDLVEWADLIFVMDERYDRHRTQLLELFPEVEGLAEKVIVLNIPDIYERDSPELIALLRQRLQQWLPDLDV